MRGIVSFLGLALLGTSRGGRACRCCGRPIAAHDAFDRCEGVCGNCR